jgi:hypothetical protein
MKVALNTITLTPVTLLKIFTVLLTLENCLFFQSLLIYFVSLSLIVKDQFMKMIMHSKYTRVVKSLSQEVESSSPRHGLTTLVVIN